MIHELKTHPEPFDAVWSGIKRFEIRKNDRDFKVGDILALREWHPQTEKYSGRHIVSTVQYMTNGGEWGIPESLCVLGLGALVLNSPATFYDKNTKVTRMVEILG